MTFFLDHDVPERVADVLEQDGHVVHRVREVLNPEAKDEDILDRALAGQWILVTCNRDDFLDLCARRRHAGLVIVLRRKTRIAECAAVLRLIKKAGAQGLEGNVNFS